MATIMKIRSETKYIKQHPYVGNDGIYIPLEPYVPEGLTSNYQCLLTKEMFIEAYNKWIKESEKD